MPNGPWPLASSLARLAFGTLAVVAMTYQFAVLNVEPGYAKGNFFSFFTIQSNILAVAALFLLVAVPNARRTALFDRARQIRRGAPLEQPPHGRVRARRGRTPLAREPARERVSIRTRPASPGLR